MIYCFCAVWGLVACSNNEPKRAFEGTWEPVGYEECDVFVVTTDSIKAVSCDTHEDHYQCYYHMVRDSVAQLERTWLIEAQRRSDSLQGDWDVRRHFYAEVQMYLDKEGYLIIHPYDYHSEWDLSQVVYYPDYRKLKLKRKGKK